jgi:hypothetical protein
MFSFDITIVSVLQKFNQGLKKYIKVRLEKKSRKNKSIKVLAVFLIWFDKLAYNYALFFH